MAVEGPRGQADLGPWRCVRRLRPGQAARLLRRWIVWAALAACPAAATADLKVFAAASLQDALRSVAARWEAATGHRAVLVFAGSSALARQIAHGAPADVFIAANAAWMDELEAKGHLLPGSRTELLRNRLVLIGAGADRAPVTLTPDFDLPAHLDGGRLAMALVDAVPAGIYGKAALAELGLWSAAAPQVAQADNVRAALALVAAGEAPLGIVYATDARAEPKVSVLAMFPKDSHPAIVYPAAAVAGGDEALATGFLTHLSSPEARAAFRAAGFGLAD